MVRAFVAVDLPCEIQEAIAKLQPALRQSQGRLVLVNPSIIHITIQFLGEVPEDRIPAIASALGTVRLPTFSLVVHGLAANPRQRPRVIWCMVSDGGGCAALARSVGDALGPLGIAREERPFHPHATVARIKGPAPDIHAVIQGIGAGVLGRREVRGFSLKKSTLTPGGPVYEDIRRVEW